MGIVIDKYVDLLGRYAIYGEKGYYIEPFIIKHMIVNELELSMTFNEIEKFINDCKISLTAEEVKEFLKKKNHKFEPYTLEYFKIYTSILKVKCRTLFGILDDLEKIKDDEISEECWDRILDLDFHINKDGEIYIPDAVRLADAIIYNVKDLYNKINQGNNCETYLNFKESKFDLYEDGIFESEIYPRKELQIKDKYYSSKNEFSALSEKQEEELRKQEVDNFKTCFSKIKDKKRGKK